MFGSDAYVGPLEHFQAAILREVLMDELDPEGPIIFGLGLGVKRLHCKSNTISAQSWRREVCGCLRSAKVSLG